MYQHIFIRNDQFCQQKLFFDRVTCVFTFYDISYQDNDTVLHYIPKSPDAKHCNQFQFQMP